MSIDSFRFEVESFTFRLEKSTFALQTACVLSSGSSSSSTSVHKEVESTFSSLELPPTTLTSTSVTVQFSLWYITCSSTMSEAMSTLFFRALSASWALLELSRRSCLALVTDVSLALRIRDLSEGPSSRMQTSDRMSWKFT